MGKASKDKRDAYYRLAKEQNWRARSAFKLIQIDEQFDLFSHTDPESVTRVVDLCAAPGSWSQVLSRVLIKGESFGRRAWLEKRRRDKRALEQLENDGEQESGEDEEDESKILKPRKNVKIVSIDLQPMAPLEGITTLKADITHPSTIPLLLRALDPEDYDQASSTEQHKSEKSLPSRHPHPVDLVISDGAPDVTGLHDLDIYIQSQLLYAALNLTIGVLRPGGKFVAKIFRGRDVDLLYAQLRTVFQKVSVAKPRSSRASSLEAFVVCEGFMPPADSDPSHALQNPIFGGAANPQVNEDGTVGAEVPGDDEEDQQSKHTKPVITDTTASADANHTVQTRLLEQLSISETAGPRQPDESRWIPAFIACGDLSAWDSDATYALPEGYVTLDPVQPPTAPPYKKVLEMRKELGGAYGKTKLGQMGRA